jgi:hypothetical protein
MRPGSGRGLVQPSHVTFDAAVISDQQDDGGVSPRNARSRGARGTCGDREHQWHQGPRAFLGEGVSPKLLVALVALVGTDRTHRYLFEEGKAPGLGIEPVQGRSLSSSPVR